MRISGENRATLAGAGLGGGLATGVQLCGFLGDTPPLARFAICVGAACVTALGARRMYQMEIQDNQPPEPPRNNRR